MPEDYCLQYVVMALVVMVLLLTWPLSVERMPCPCNSQLKKSLADFSCSEGMVIEEVAMVVKVVVVVVLSELRLFLSHAARGGFSDRRECTSFQNLST